MPPVKILVADDEPFIVRSLTFVLKKEGFDVDSATNGEEALARVRTAKPAIVFLDVMMPKRNGYDVCTEIKQDPLLKDIYVIMLTAKGQESDRTKGLGAGANEFITKPFSPMQVMARVKELAAAIGGKTAI